VRPLAGDWDGDGVDGIAVYDTLEKKLYLNNRTNGDRSTEQQVTFAWAGTNWLALAGDWDGDGRSTIGFVDPTNSVWRLSNRIDGTTTDLAVFTWSLPAGWQPLAGDWNGQGGISS
jgi:endoglucanase